MKNYRFNAWSPTGTFLRTFDRDHSYLRSAGLRLQVTPEGDGREGSFNARGDGILLPSLSAVQIEYEDALGYKPIFYGQVRQGGNARDTDGENYILRSLGLRLHAVTLSAGFVAPQQPAHLTVRAIIQDVIASSQLGSPSLIQYTGGVFDTIPDLPFDCREIRASNQQMAGPLLDQIVQDAAGLGVEVRWGVRPDREFYFRQRDESSLILNQSDFARVTWRAPVAETPCTSLLWFVAERPNGGGWITYPSVSPLAATYGTWVQQRTIPTGLNAWQTAPFTPTLINVTAGGDSAALTDRQTILGDGNPVGVVYSLTDTTQPGEIRFAVPYAAHSRTDIFVRFLGGTMEELPGMLIASDDLLTPAVRFLYAPGGGTEPRVEEMYFPPTGLNATTFIYRIKLPAGSYGVHVLEFRPERMDTALLDNLAKYYYSVPAQEPAEIPLVVYVNPQDLTGHVEFGDYSRPVDAWEYRISSARGLEKVALTGQAGDPNKLAQAALIKANDNKAVITAVTAQRS